MAGIQSPRNATFLIFGVVTMVSCLSLLWYCLRLVFSESVSFRRPSIAYSLLVPAEIGDWACPKPVSEPRYWSSCGDGCAPPCVEVRWETTESEAALASATVAYLTGLGYRFRDREHGYDVYEGKGYALMRYRIEPASGSVRRHILERSE